MKATKSRLHVAISILLLFVGYACEVSPSIDEATEKEKILALHNLQKEYHFEKMTKEFVAQLSDSYLAVNRGEIKEPTKEESIAMFQPYFDAVSFEKWDDTHPPIIRFSDDYSLAYTVVSKEVIVNYPVEGVGSVRDTTEYAWVAIYKKYKEGWKIDCVVSTNKPTD